MFLGILLAANIMNFDVDNTLFNTKVQNRQYIQVYEKEKHDMIFYFHKGGKQIDNEKHKDNIRAVMSRLDFIPQDENIVNLVFETSLAETHGGYWVRSTYNNADKGIYQINKYTYKDLMIWIKRQGLEKQVMQFYDNKQDLEFNLVHNAAFNCALCISHYYRYYGDALADTASSLIHRAKMWKERYNTKLGKGSVKSYLIRVAKYGNIGRS